MDVREVFRSLARMRASISNLEVEGMDHGIQILEDLEYVEKTWEVITAVLADAEKLEIRYETVKLWLRNLRNLAYDIEELVDLYEYQVKALDADALADAVAAAKEAMDVREVLHSLARMRASISKLEVEGMDGIQILEDLEYVQTTSWEVITAVLADAEKLEVPYETVKLWLRNLRNVAYDIEDLVDLYGYQVKALNAAAEKVALLDPIVARIGMLKDGMKIQIEIMDLLRRMRASTNNLEVEGMDRIQIMLDLKDLVTTWSRISITDAKKKETGHIKIVLLTLSELRHVASLARNLFEYQVKDLQADAEEVEEMQKKEKLKLLMAKFSSEVCEIRNLLEDMEDDGHGQRFNLNPIRDASSSSHGGKELEFNKTPPVQGTLFSPFQDASFRKEISEGVKKIRKQIHDIAEQKQTFHWLIELGRSRTLPDDDGGDDRHSGSCPDPAADRFVGRSKQKDELVGMLQNDEVDGVEVIAVIGMGGIGKTTLSQHIYNDSRIKAHFDAKGWVYVGESLNKLQVTRNILNCFVEKGNVTFQQLGRLQEELIKQLQGRRFLLVLDDVWCDDIQIWDTIKAPLMQCGVKGSKILFTSRNKEVAFAATSACPYQLDVLSEKDGWSLFQKYANIVDEYDDKKLADVRNHVFEKCRGLPLAIKLIGTMLGRKGHDFDKWKAILNSDWWDANINKGEEKILKPLYLSYLHLPSHLKACFKFFSLMKKGMVVSSEWLVHLWIAHGIIKNESGKVSLKELGEELIDNLASRSLLERSCLSPPKAPEDELAITKFGAPFHYEKDYHDYGIIVHDLIVDTARYVTGNEFCMKEDYTGDGTLELPNDTRHLRLNVGDYPINLKGTIGLHTLILDKEYLCDEDCRDIMITSKPTCIKSLHLLSARQTGIKMFMRSHLHTLKHLRVLHLSYSTINILLEPLYTLFNLVVLDLRKTKVTKISSLLSNLKRLQVLDLSCTPIEIIPESICQLTALEELNLQGCDKILVLPTGITRLTNLRSLDLRESSIQHMPLGLSNLTKLRYLPYYPLCFEKMTDLLKDLKCLELQGTRSLHIGVIYDLLRKEIRDEAQMPYKGNFHRLSITFSCNENLMPLYVEEMQVLELLRPHTDIKEVEISSFHGVKLPLWMGDQSFVRLVCIHLAKFTTCRSLSHLHQLPSLRMLYLHEMDLLKEVVPKEINHECSSNSYTMSKHNICFPKLEIINLWVCDALESLPVYRLNALRKLQVCWCKNLKSIHFLNPYSLEKEHQAKENLLLTDVQLMDCPQLHFPSNISFPSSTKLIKVEYCRGLYSWCKKIQNQTEKGFCLIHHPSEEGDDGGMVMFEDDDDDDDNDDDDEDDDDGDEEEEENSDQNINMDEEEEEEEEGVPSFSHSTEGEFMFVEDKEEDDDG